MDLHDEVQLGELGGVLLANQLFGDGRAGLGVRFEDTGLLDESGLKGGGGRGEVFAEFGEEFVVLLEDGLALAGRSADVAKGVNVVSLGVEGEDFDGGALLLFILAKRVAETLNGIFKLFHLCSGFVERVSVCLEINIDDFICLLTRCTKDSADFLLLAV